MSKALLLLASFVFTTVACAGGAQSTRFGSAGGMAMVSATTTPTTSSNGSQASPSAGGSFGFSSGSGGFGGSGTKNPYATPMFMATKPLR